LTGQASGGSASSTYTPNEAPLETFSLTQPQPSQESTSQLEVAVQDISELIEMMREELVLGAKMEEDVGAIFDDARAQCGILRYVRSSVSSPHLPRLCRAPADVQIAPVSSSEDLKIDQSQILSAVSEIREFLEMLQTVVSGGGKLDFGKRAMFRTALAHIEMLGIVSYLVYHQSRR
jgi:hypothetical protein